MIVLVLIGLFIITALLTAAEMATFSARPERMRQASSKNGTLVLAYQRSPVSFLAAGQVIATAASFGIGAIIQAAITPWLVAQLANLPTGKAEREILGSTFALLAMTILALIFTNVVPKQIGFDHADRLALLSAAPFRILIRLTRPIAWLVTKTSKVCETLINRKIHAGDRVTERDLTTLIAEGLRLGTLDRVESDFVKRALSLSDTKVVEIATPISQIEGVNLSMNSEEVDQIVRNSNHSFLAVFAGGPENPVGVLKARDWLTRSHDATLDQLMVPADRLSAQSSAIGLFEVLALERCRMVFIEQDGAVTGAVTMNDAMRLLTGDLSALGT